MPLTSDSTMQKNNSFLAKSAHDLALYHPDPHDPAPYIVISKRSSGPLIYSIANSKVLTERERVCISAQIRLCKQHQPMAVWPTQAA